LEYAITIDKKHYIYSKKSKTTNRKLSFQMFLCRIYNPEEHGKNIYENVTFLQNNQYEYKILIIGACGQIEPS
jgi:hypothetical protein